MKHNNLQIRSILEIKYGLANSPFGECFVAVTPKGVCVLEFTEIGRDSDSCLTDAKAVWRDAVFIPDNAIANSVITAFFEHSEMPEVDVRGTEFQKSVWIALQTIPLGKTVTYSDIARLSGNPKAIRAAASAVASNPVSLIIPCHRVVRKSGETGQYRWGADRKIALLKWEANIKSH